MILGPHSRLVLAEKSMSLDIFWTRKDAFTMQDDKLMEKEK